MPSLAIAFPSVPSVIIIGRATASGSARVRASCMSRTIWRVGRAVDRRHAHHRLDLHLVTGDLLQALQQGLLVGARQRADVDLRLADARHHVHLLADVDDGRGHRVAQHAVERALHGRFADGRLDGRRDGLVVASLGQAQDLAQADALEEAAHHRRRSRRLARGGEAAARQRPA